MPTQTRTFARLKRSIDWSRTRLRPYRERRFERVRQFVGYHYSESGAPDRVPVNMLELAVNIYRRQLAARSPAVNISTPVRDLRTHAEDFELAITHLLDEIEFSTTLQRWVTDAMFLMGILKVGRTSQARGEVVGWSHDASQPFADVVDFDDWCHDMTARCYEEVQHAENRYVLPLDFVQGSGEFKNTDKLSPTDMPTTNEQGDRRVTTIGRDDQVTGANNEYDPTIELWDVWIPRDKRVVTFPATQQGGGIASGTPVREVDWDGPEEGPFHLLSYEEVPGSVLPLAPTALLMDLHLLANRVFRKLARQVERQKTVTVVQGGADEDGKRVQKASDGDIIRSDRPEATREMRYGGIDQPSLAMYLQTKGEFTWVGGNLDALGGLSPQAETLGQEELLVSSASQRLADMQQATVNCTRKVIRALGMYLWHDPTADYVLLKTVKGSKRQIPVEFRSDLHEGDIVDYNIDIVPYSMQDRTPAQRLQTVTQVLERMLLPMQPLMQAQGKAIDIDALMELVAKYSDVPEVMELVTNLTAAQQEAVMSPGGERPLQSPVTTRRNVRVNRPGASRGGKEAALTQTLVGGGAQQSEMDSIGRPTG